MYKLLLSAVLLVSACNEGLSSTENPIIAGDCTLTQGYWKNHPDAWPVTSLELGSRTYSKAEALSSYDISYKGASFLLRVLDATGGSRLVALSPDGRMLTSGEAAELMAAIKAKF